MSGARVWALRGASGPGPGPGCWEASHVEVWVWGARGLRASGGSGAVALVELGGQRRRTGVASLRGGAGGEAGSPRWGEEVVLELPPDAAQAEPQALQLQLSVWQRALVGPDRFLGRAELPLHPLLRAGRAHPEQ